MQLVITSEDFQRLSASTRKELLALLIGGDVDGEVLFGVDDYDASNGAAEQGGGALHGKRVFAINPAQASELLANLAEKSQQTLRMFALDERIPVDVLVGKAGPYKDMNDLKRSFVGAVNRRLRTVVGDRSAVLFSSDRDRQRIRILPLTAAALRQAMGIPESAPHYVAEGLGSDTDLDSEWMLDAGP